MKNLFVCSRKIDKRHRHLYADLLTILPNAKKGKKTDNLEDLKQMTEEKNCTNCVYFEGISEEFLVLWISRIPSGPTVKFFVSETHTIDELKSPGNGYKGSRHVLMFDERFDETPRGQVLKQVLKSIFVVDKKFEKRVPIVDRVISFSIIDSKIVMRHYQVDFKTPTNLAEIGPRMTLQYIQVEEGSFTGKIMAFDKDTKLRVDQIILSVRSKYRARPKEEKRKAKRRKISREVEGWIEETFDTLQAERK